MVTAIFDKVVGSADGIDRLEPCADWLPYVVAALPKPVTLRGAPTERKPEIIRAALDFFAGRLGSSGQ